MKQGVSARIGAALALLLCLVPLGMAHADQSQPAGSTTATAPPSRPVPTVTVEPERPALVPATILNRFPHDTGAFTEGLIADGDTLYESVGLEGRSEVRRVALATGAVTARARIPAEQFGEGLARWRGELVSLTWHDGIAHRWRAQNLRHRGQWRYAGEGWGLASDQSGFILSDGSATLRFLEPHGFREVRRITVTVAGRPMSQLNELEVVDGRILANVWMTPFILVIDPVDGHVTHVLDLRVLADEMAQASGGDPEAVANGIAWDARSRRLFVTGKRWSTLFEIAVPW